MLNYKKKIYSSPGNDGIIEYIYKKLNISNGIFVEFGAWDGIRNSNCRRLFEKGWKGIFIEYKKKRYQKLKKNYKNFFDIYCLNKKVGSKTGNKKDLFDNIVDPYLDGRNIDFCSIDIDGLDLECFETFEKYFPTVICIEGGQVLHPYYGRVGRSISSKNIGQSLKVTIDCFEKKNYKILCSYQDCFFIKKEFYNIFNVSENIIKLYLNGLKARPKMISHYCEYLRKSKIKNTIIEYLLKKTSYNNYGYKKRNCWIEKESKNVISIINKMHVKEKFGDLFICKNR